VSDPAAGLSVGLQLFPGAARDVVAEARTAEALGFSSVWVADHFHGAGRETGWVVPECFTTLAAIAASTERVGLGSCVVSTTKRDPAQIAHAALTLSQLSGGRFALGLGTGFGPDLRAFGAGARKPAARLEATLGVLDELFASSPDRPYSGDWEERHFEGAFLNLPGAEPPPVLLAAIGPRLLKLTGQRADGWLPFGLTPEVYAQFLERLAPQRPGFAPKLWLPTFVERPGEDRSAEAEATGRLYLSMAPGVLEATLDGSGFEGVVPNSLDWTPETARQIGESIPRELALAAVLHGSPEQCLATLEKFERAGCREVVLRITDAEQRPADAAYIAENVLAPLEESGTGASGSAQSNPDVDIEGVGVDLHTRSEHGIEH
jgi:phthiodiolone/phenolphthiodiolone dimycocerosates ketoreductase